MPHTSKVQLLCMSSSCTICIWLTNSPEKTGQLQPCMYANKLQPSRLQVGPTETISYLACENILDGVGVCMWLCIHVGDDWDARCHNLSGCKRLPAHKQTSLRDFKTHGYICVLDFDPCESASPPGYDSETPLRADARVRIQQTMSLDFSTTELCMWVHRLLQLVCMLARVIDSLSECRMCKT